MADGVFLALAVLTIGSAIAALEMRSLIYGSIALMGSLGGVAGFFFLLDAPFVALFQLAVYVGSIAVLILFTVMLVRRELIFRKIEDTAEADGRHRPAAGLHGGGGRRRDIVGDTRHGHGLAPPSTTRDIGADFLIYYWPALVVMALILSGAVTGALVLARREDGPD